MCTFLYTQTFIRSDPKYLKQQETTQIFTISKQFDRIYSDQRVVQKTPIKPSGKEIVSRNRTDAKTEEL